MHYLCVQLTWGHQICTTEASEADDRFASCLTYFSKSQKSKCEAVQFWVNKVA